MSKHMGAQFASLSVSIRVAGSGYPQGVLGLHGAGEALNRDFLAERVAETDFLTPPQASDLVDLLEHHALVFGVVLWTQQKVVGLPPRGKGQCDPTVAQVVDHSP